MYKQIYISFMLLFCANVIAQEASYYLPYQMPTHAAVKFNTFLANPALPLLGYQEQNIGLYYRTQWMGYKDDSFSLMGASYGINWNETSSVNALIYKRNVGLFANTGAVINYGHQVEFYDGMGLRLGLNVIPTFTSLDRGRIVVHSDSDPLLTNAKSAFGFTLQPGFDINIGKVHFGVTAENLFDYSLGNKKTMTPFEEKTFTGHLMYRSQTDSSTDMFEDGYWSITARATKESSGINMSGNILFDMPKLGWTYAGYSQKYGIFAGLGFHIKEYLSIGLEYEKDVASKIPKLGNTFGAYVNVQFGGDRQKAAASLRLKQKMKRDEARKRAEERRLKNAAKLEEKPKATPEPPVVQDTIPKTTTPEPAKTPEKEPEVKLPDRGPDTDVLGLGIRVRTDKISSPKIPPGYYVIVGVYSDPRNAFRFIQEYRKKYSVAGFLHPKLNNTYVYLGSAGMAVEEARGLYQANLMNNDFANTGIWILKVE